MDEQVIISSSLSGMVRIYALFCFFFLNPLFVYVWLDNPKFVNGKIDFPEIFMAVTTILMLSLGFWGFFACFEKVYLYDDRIVIKGLFRRRELNLRDVSKFDKVHWLHGTAVITLLLKSGGKFEFSAASKELVNRVVAKNEG